MFLLPFDVLIAPTWPAWIVRLLARRKRGVR
jgi:hypothetical protein